MNLTETAIFTKRAAVLAILFVFAFFFTKFSFNIAKAVFLRAYPPAPPPVTTVFGKLPPINIPKLPIEGGDNIVYSIDTPTGRFPTLVNRAKIFEIVKQSATMLSESRARALARSLSFTNEPTRVSSADLHWDDIPNSRSLDINIVTGNFSLKTDFAKLALELSPGSAPTQAQAINTALAFYTNKQLITSDYLQGNQTASMIKLVSGQPREAQSLSEAQIMRVNLFRQVDKLNVLSSNPKESLLKMDLAAQNQGVSSPQIQYLNWGLSLEKVGEYPLKDIDKAFSELKAGLGAFTYLKLRGQDYFAPYSPVALAQVSIRTVEVAYFDSSLMQDYLQPIFVFGGIFKTTGGSEGEFVAFVPALDPAWAETPSNSQPK